jgi:hypothetical protein
VETVVDNGDVSDKPEEAEAPSQEEPSQETEETISDEEAPLAGDDTSIGAAAVAGIVIGIAAVIALLGYVLTKLGLLRIFK